MSKVTGIVVGSLALTLATIILILSWWQHIGNEVEEQVLAKDAVVQVSDQTKWKAYDNNKVTSTLLPGNVGYMAEATFDRVQLWLQKEPDKRCLKLIELSSKRMDTIDELMMENKGRLALQTAVKGIYYWEAARNFLTTHDESKEEHEWLWQQLNQHGEKYLTQVTLMKQTLNEPAQAGIDRLLETIRLGLERVSVN